MTCAAGLGGDGSSGFHVHSLQLVVCDVRLFPYAVKRQIQTKLSILLPSLQDAVPLFMGACERFRIAEPYAPCSRRCFAFGAGVTVHRSGKSGERHAGSPRKRTFSRAHAGAIVSPRVWLQDQQLITMLLHCCVPPLLRGISSSMVALAKLISCGHQKQTPFWYACRTRFRCRNFTLLTRPGPVVISSSARFRTRHNPAAAPLSTVAGAA